MAKAVPEFEAQDADLQERTEIFDRLDKLGRPYLLVEIDLDENDQPSGVQITGQGIDDADGVSVWQRILYGVSMELGAEQNA